MDIGIRCNGQLGEEVFKSWTTTLGTLLKSLHCEGRFEPQSYASAILIQARSHIASTLKLRYGLKQRVYSQDRYPRQRERGVRTLFRRSPKTLRNCIRP